MEYVVERGGKVTVACTVKAHPAVLTFTWALKATPGESQGKGRKEGEGRGEWILKERRKEGERMRILKEGEGVSGY
ncbi:hypothetical protein Pmani_025173 [Petrolisthes manimaculis]|uniref:Ig-like domain-containing protein n=1 Tax=Petrolisthes manimaculis TaxID=1843537 RepID=A0AAE1TXW7_9EUCA|nr:hypothetical protein Pmani_025173 [Petrolisthes manimaculis]